MEIFENKKKLVGLRAVLVCAESDSLQCQPARSWTPRSVSLRRVQLPAVLANFGFADISIFNSVQCQPPRSLTPCRLYNTAQSRIFELRILIPPLKRIFKINHFSLFIRVPDGFDLLNKKNGKKSCDTAPLRLNIVSILTMRDYKCFLILASSRSRNKLCHGRSFQC